MKAVVVPLLILAVIGVQGVDGSDSGCTSAGGSCMYTSSPCSGTWTSGLCSGPASRKCCIDPDRQCTNAGGSCMYTSSPCSGTWTSGLCSGPASRKCCIDPDSGCTDAGGSCMYTSNSCSGTWTSGLCSGPASRKCCVGATGPDSACINAGGSCMYTTSPCAGTWTSGLCSGTASRRCCIGSGSCSLVTISKPNIKGYGGKAVRVDSGFVSAMNLTNFWAGECGVKVLVTSSFRKENVPVSGAIVIPASRSNHKVGHAIDMNLETNFGLCNSVCLGAQTNSQAKCFTDKIQPGGLRWGKYFSATDPVHIDDGLNLNDPHAWKKLYEDLQRNC